MFFWLLIALILIWALMVPSWPYHRRYGYGYYPFGIISAILLLFILFWWLGLFVVAI
jgi:lysylphosphatidylglycerol synthetase-like protein (DUF2156 family)